MTSANEDMERRRLRHANYRSTDDRARMCRVCQTQTLISNNGIRICKMNTAFVTCGGTCDYFERDKELKE